MKIRKINEIEMEALLDEAEALPSDHVTVCTADYELASYDDEFPVYDFNREKIVNIAYHNRLTVCINKDKDEEREYYSIYAYYKNTYDDNYGEWEYSESLNRDELRSMLYELRDNFISRSLETNQLRRVI